MIDAPRGAARRVDRAVLLATVIFSIAALGCFAVLSLRRHVPGSAAALVYAATLVACSVSSCLYNLQEQAPRRAALRYLDHAAIFLLIAGTYTPFATGVGQLLGFGLLYWVWGLSLTGIALKLLLRCRYERFFIGMYLVTGWFGLAALGDVVDAFAPSVLLMLALGGLGYTAGALIYAHGGSRWTSPVWHACVLFGAVSHFLAVLANLTAGGLWAA
jgi:hemolysin III